MKLKVLIIEDNEQNMYMLTFLLKNNNYEVFQAFNGKEGIKAAIDIQPDVILLDIQLPEMDGYHVAKELTSIESIKDIPIIAVTSHAMIGDREKAMESGVTGYIEKPIDPDNFIIKMEAYMKESNAFKNNIKNITS